MTETDRVLRGLSWLRDEIDRSLDEAAAAIQDYTEDYANRRELERCGQHLRDARGSFAMLGLTDLAQLARELELLLADFIARADDDGREDVQDALMTGTLRLADCIDRIEAGQHGTCAQLGPLLHRIQRLRGKAVNPPSDSGEPGTLHSVARAGRAVYQRGLLQLLRGRLEAVPQMVGLAERLSQASQRPPMQECWWRVRALLEDLGKANSAPSPGMRVLLGMIDRQLRDLARSDATEQERQIPSADLLDALRVAQPGREFDTPPGRSPASAESVARPGAAVLRAAALAIEEDLAALEDALDMVARGGEAEVGRLADAEDILTRVAGALAMAGLVVPANAIRQRREAIAACRASGHADEAEMVEVARALLLAETSLEAAIAGAALQPEDALNDDGSISDAALFRLRQGALRRQVLHEVLHDIDGLKDGVMRRLRDGDSAETVNELGNRLAGALSILGMGRCRDLLESAINSLDRLISGDSGGPTEDEETALAESIAGVELFLENELDGHQQRDDWLNRAELRLASLQKPETLPEFEGGESLSGADATDADGVSEPAPSDDAAGEVQTGALPEEEPVPDVESASEIDDAAMAEPGEAATASEGPAEPGSGTPVPEGDDGAVTASRTEPLVGAGFGEAVNHAVPVRALELDEELVEIFLEEMEEVLTSLEEHIPRWLEDSGDREPLTVIRRNFHTIKGSGRTIGALLVGELAWSVERLLNRLLAGQVRADKPVRQLVQQVTACLPAMVEELRGGPAPEQDPRELMRQADRLADSAPGESPAQPPESADQPAASASADDDEAAPSYVVSKGPPQPVLDPALYEVFRNETDDHLQVISAFLDRCREQGYRGQVNEPLARALHTLSGSARMAEVMTLASLGRAMETLVCAYRDQGRAMQGRELELLDAALRRTRELVASLADARLPQPEVADLIERADVFMAELPEAIRPAFADKRTPGDSTTQEDDELLLLFLEEAEDLIQVLGESVDDWQRTGDTRPRLAELRRTVHTLKGGARLAQCAPMGNLCQGLESVLQAVDARSLAVDDGLFDVLRRVHERLDDMLAALRMPAEPEEAEELLAELAEFGRTAAAPDVVEPAQDDEPALVELFLEEATDALQLIGERLGQWQLNPSDSSPLAEIRRALHTLKGGARMAGLSAIADLAHEVEALLERQRGELRPEPAVREVLERSHGRLQQMCEQAAAGSLPEPAVDLRRALRDLELPEPVQAAPQATQAPRRLSGQPSASGDQIRVPSELLDTLVNEAAEISVYRSRIEQQMSGFRFNLGELEQTVGRVRDQLRSLEIETEKQIRYRFDRDPAADNGSPQFDPLELDRFSRMQELSRALAESMNDLSSLQGLLDGMARDSETLLQQQARLGTSLQDGLMRTRMVPFAQLVPRLRRVVRQTAEELGRQVYLDVGGVEGEMDRTVLERMVAPLEHLLRNAVAHGIETPGERRTAGKPEQGTIGIQLRREGSDVILRVEDDGGGLRFQAIRERAVERGLLTDDAESGEQDLARLILAQGFSTATEVTQISGRGVGMDVVNAQIKQLGGSIDIASRANEGTSFTLRLPFTLAVNRALLCQVEEQAFAMPLNGVRAVVWMAREELMDRLSSDVEADHMRHYDDEPYRIMSLAQLLGMGESTPPQSLKRVPLVLVSVGDTRLALYVDALMGNREVVVKSVGLQVSAVPGVLGATLLGDGSVVLILDLPALIGADPAEFPSAPDGEMLAADLPERAPLVMVVDDSITMRKVASRLLERHGMRVITARDGVDAVALLQENRPDAMLLDIEMPRMDGYELTSFIRNEPALCELPIIMVTSRTGEKHRQRALELGVQHYLGKPYQESVLLGHLDQLLGLAIASESEPSA
ncbi:Hpt domain-containing protein [Methylonatrum kenyense]|uniref:Hpt domain-containing protein n=1 Tax=Methylonatrum kenyense TaxID=455253 RepID=UPI0020C10587|nr:Hpt domain-containing protein [Methylonatrum kenyense]MCK8516631.1 Hpt domain-containing protein [Methylonatrum kenyense]